MHKEVERYPTLSRRDLLRLAGVGLSGLGLAAIVGCGDGDEPTSGTITPLATDPPPETTRLRVPRISSICMSPQYLAEEFFRDEGFTDVQYVNLGGAGAIPGSLASGETDIGLHFVVGAAVGIDAGDPVVVIGGAHVGCWELVGSDAVQSVRDLRGKTVAVSEEVGRATDYTFALTVLTFGGIDLKDLNFEAHKKDEAIQLLKEGKLDALLVLPPTGQQLRAQNIGHVLVDGHLDRPWSQYYCCLVQVNGDFLARNPVATKRALRAILKGADVIAAEPERAARFIVDKGYTDNYDYALETMSMLPYNVWREFDPEDSLRFYSLRLNEAGIIKSTPDEIIAGGTDWRYFNELRQELKETTTTLRHELSEIRPELSRRHEGHH